MKRTNRSIIILSCLAVVVIALSTALTEFMKRNIVMSSIDAFINQQNSYRAANGIALDYNLASGAMPAGGNGVVGFQNYNFTAGYGTVVLDGPKSSYAIEVDGTGKTVIKDIGVGDATYGQSVTVTGENYIVFNGANLGASTVMTGGAATYPNDMYFVENAANAQLAEFYAAILQRIPDLGGLEYWQNSAAGGTGVIGVAENFVVAIHNSYATSSPITTLGGDPDAMTPTQFVTALYENILGRDPDASGLAYWVAGMNTWIEQYGLRQAQADMLVSFTNATATSAAVNAIPGSAPGTGTGWLISYSLTGGYADPTVQQSAQTVLDQSVGTNYLSTSLIDPSTIPSSLGGATNANHIIIQAGNVGVGVATQPSTPPTTIALSAGVPIVAVANDGDTIISPTGGGATIKIYASNTDITLTGANNIVELLGDSVANPNAVGADSPAAINNTIMGYVPGSDHLRVGMLYNNWAYDHLAVQLLTPTAGSPVNGAGLNFTANTYILNVGNVGGGSAAEVAAAANAAYTVADKNGNAALSGTASYGENLIIIGQAGTNTVVYQFANITSPTGHMFGAPLSSPDANGNHLIDASEISFVATLVGVQSSHLSVEDFQ